MRFALASVALATLATTVSGAVHQVAVGGTGLAFNPSQLTAAVGDTVQFVFGPKNHSVTQSTFAAPCTFMAGGADSGFMPSVAGAATQPMFTVTVTQTTPLWFYCRQANHCQQGMVFAINPTAQKSFAAFQQAAMGTTPDAAGGTSASASSASASASASASSESTSGSTTTSSAPAASSSTTNGAIATGAGAGGLLALVGIAAGILL
ncbi:Cupredoxin [Lactifluus volemus]|nr:Cupredoxin [Lactifluus volemus]